MKKSILFSALLLIATTTFATILTVSNQVPSPGQYITIQLAINAASPGDTVYVHGSNIYYGGFALDRQLTIIGTGFQPSSANPNPTSVIAVGPGVSINNVNASGSKIIGLYISNNSISFSVGGIHDVTISRCYLYGGNTVINFAPNMYNITIAENIIWGHGLSYGWNGSIGTPHDFLITNNVFYQSYYGNAFTNWYGVLNTQVVNNLFYGNGTPSIVETTSGGSGFSFSNNIFNKISFSGLSGSTFSNNITNQCSGNTPWINNGTDLGVVLFGTQNIANTSPDFVNQTAIDAISYGGNVNWFEVNPGSPTLSSMPTDTDMGPYGGGSYDYHKASASTLPYVYSIVIANPNIQAGTDLNIDVIGEKHD